MAKHLDRFTKAFADSRIPFLLVEVLTNGSGEMVDLIFRFINAPAATLLGAAPDALKNLRFSHAYPADRLRDLAPLAEVAFSGSAVSFPYETVLGKRLTVTCYQPMYGMACCVLESGSCAAVRSPADLLAENLPGGVAVLEVGSRGVRILSFNSHLCELARCSRKEFFNRFAENAAPLIYPDDWPGLLQDLMDAARDNLAVNHDVRLNRRTGGALWVNLRADILSEGTAGATFYAMLLDIDQRRREQEQLEQASRKVEELQREYNQLLDNIPGGLCVFQVGDGGFPPELRRAGQGFCRLLGYSEAEILRRVNGDFFWHVHPDDRDAFAAAVRAWHYDTPFFWTFRLRQKGGNYLWLSLETSACRTPDGGQTVYAAYTDVTLTHARQAEQCFRAELADLLLESREYISIDYDPAGDVGRLGLADPEGRRVIRTLPEYRKSLSVSSSIHPAHRKSVQSALRQAMAKPGRFSLEYLGNYGEDGYRWYRASCVSLADDRGNVFRVIGKAENISVQKAAVERFRARKTRWETQSAPALCAARLDLTANRPLDAKSASLYLTRALFGNTADEWLDSLRGGIPDGESQIRWSTVYTRNKLLESFRLGESMAFLEHRLFTGEESARWVRTAVELAENPHTHHVEAFFRSEDIDGDAFRNRVGATLLEREFDFSLAIDVRSRHSRICGGESVFPAGETDFYKLVQEYIDSLVLPEDRKQMRSATDLPNVTRRLKKAERYECFCRLTGEGGAVRRKRWEFFWLDERREILVAAVRDVTADAPQPQN